MGITDKTHEGIVSEQLRHETNRNWENTLENDRLDGIWWGLVFLWGALVLLLDNISFSANYTWWDGWGVFLTGAGVMALIAVPIRLILPEYRRKVGETLIFGLILLGFGLALDWMAVVILFIIGVAIVRSAFTSQPA